MDKWEYLSVSLSVVVEVISADEREFVPPDSEHLPSPSYTYERSTGQRIGPFPVYDTVKVPGHSGGHYHLIKEAEYGLRLNVNEKPVKTVPLPHRPNTVEHYAKGQELLNAYLCELGDEGWELVSIPSFGATSLFAVFKRRKP